MTISERRENVILVVSVKALDQPLELPIESIEGSYRFFDSIEYWLKRSSALTYWLARVRLAREYYW